MTLEVGMWPWCPHPGGSAMIIDDQLDGGARWCETFGHDPVWLDGTKSQWKRLMDVHGVENVVRHEQTYYDRHRREQTEKFYDTRRERES